MSTAVYIEAVQNAAIRDAAARDAAIRDAAARDAAIRRRSTGVLFSSLFVLKFSGVCINDEKRRGLCLFVNTQKHRLWVVTCLACLFLRFARSRIDTNRPKLEKKSSRIMLGDVVA